MENVLAWVDIGCGDVYKENYYDGLIPVYESNDDFYVEAYKVFDGFGIKCINFAYDEDERLSGLDHYHRELFFEEHGVKNLQKELECMYASKKLMDKFNLMEIYIMGVDMSET